MTVCPATNAVDEAGGSRGRIAQIRFTEDDGVGMQRSRVEQHRFVWRDYGDEMRVRRCAVGGASFVGSVDRLNGLGDRRQVASDDHEQVVAGLRVRGLQRAA